MFSSFGFFLLKVTFLQTVHTINNMNVGVNGDSGSNFHGHINSSNISSLDHLVALLLTLSDFHENPSQHQTAKSVPSSPSSASKKNLLNRGKFSYSLLKFCDVTHY